ncbi:MAG: NADH-quinone oxidoreductase subunit J [Elusimicrobiales bacterium]|nr:NADH-quinone oxidoreductase subunit J [Elusimicrobiales bacterium]HOJ86000.1 NADH-quinone oxidoreductase subunit J [Elusimicrobiales bacterium]HOL63625.1 NADH-quinone oxidoreductase subunit J [Elusimicrobiales bacterium]HPO94403.1 NADH-quinone oxidoreductase subunit J [Elusimicrobiales bacterium]
MTLYLLIYFIIIMGAVVAVISKKLINSAIMLALLSIGVSILLFAYNAPWAAVFELSVCAGLITVLFVSAVSLVKHDEENIKENRVKYVLLPLLLIGFIISASIIVPEYFSKLQIFSTYNTQKEEPIGKLIWLYRGVDIIGQLTLLASSVFVIKHIFFKRKEADNGGKI